MIKLLPNWKTITRKASSFRLAILAAVLSGVEIILPMFESAIPPLAFAILSFICAVMAAVTRLFVQQGITPDED
ncbi:MAG: hypothetical protein CMI13_12225 [Oleibacter sp.]|nr:hypothetical protein [Thalassolituus sp.]|tara:strand:+ start:122 stop:343 length:222 start_codon:yes stop_codon:yes gene_type:complete